MVDSSRYTYTSVESFSDGIYDRCNGTQLPGTVYGTDTRSVSMPNGRIFFVYASENGNIILAWSYDGVTILDDTILAESGSNARICIGEHNLPVVTWTDDNSVKIYNHNLFVEGDPASGSIVTISGGSGGASFLINESSDIVTFYQSAGTWGFSTKSADWLNFEALPIEALPVSDNFLLHDLIVDNDWGDTWESRRAVIVWAVKHEDSFTLEYTVFGNTFGVDNNNNNNIASVGVDIQDVAFYETFDVESINTAAVGTDIIGILIIEAAAADYSFAQAAVGVDIASILMIDTIMPLTVNTSAAVGVDIGGITWNYVVGSFTDNLAPVAVGVDIVSIVITGT